MSEAVIALASAAVVASKSAVASPVIRVDLRNSKARWGLVSLPFSSLALTANLFVSGSLI